MESKEYKVTTQEAIKIEAAQIHLMLMQRLKKINDFADDLTSNLENEHRRRQYHNNGIYKNK